MQLHIHIHNHYKNEDKILQKLEQMANELESIKEKLIAADVKIDKVAADVARLHEIINNNPGGELPAQEQWDEVVALANSLNDKLQAVDDSTPE